MKKLNKKIRRAVKGFMKENSGEGALSFIITALIVVIIGAALLALLQNAVPDLWDNIMDMIIDTFTL